MRRRTTLSAVVSASMLATACSTAGGFRSDALRFETPGPAEHVQLPVRLSWEAPPDAKRFAVFVDRLPLTPGAAMRSVADATCERTPGCPNETYFRERGIYVTDARSLRLTNVPEITGMGSRSASPTHRVTVVVLDSSDRRDGGDAATVTFRTDQ